MSVVTWALIIVIMGVLLCACRAGGGKWPR